VDAQRGLADGPVRVRMGLHTGEPRVTEEGYVGIDVHRGARIAAVGHGGQVLLSQTTHALVDHKTRDLGAHRLKDLSAPERIYQLEIEGLPREFPLLKTVEAGMKNLPLPRTSFVGRATELEAIDRLRTHSRHRLTRMDNVGIAVDDLPATIEFFRELGASPSRSVTFANPRRGHVATPAQSVRSRRKRPASAEGSDQEPMEA